MRKSVIKQTRNALQVVGRARVQQLCDKRVSEMSMGNDDMNYLCLTRKLLN